MRRGFKLSLALAVLALLLTLFPAYALADEFLTQFGGNPLAVAAGHSTETVITVDTDARIAGTVTDVVLAVNGNVYLEPTAHVDLVIALGGHVFNPAELPVKTGIFELNFTQTLINQLLLGVALLLGVWFGQVVLSLLAIVLFTLLGYLLQRHLARARDLIAVSGLRLFGMGTGSALVIICLAVLLSLTVIGIPLAVLLLLVIAAAAILGLIPVIDYWGSKLLAQKVQEYPALTRWLIQSLLFVAVVNLPLMGFVVLLAAAITGLGLTLTLGWIYVKGRNRVKVNP